MKTVTFDEKNRIIVIQTPGGEYYIQAADIQTDAEAADWISHIRVKTWGPPILPELVKMFNRLRPGR